MYISPDVFSSNPEIIDNNVDFPHPLGPIMLTNSPSFILKFTFFSACISPFLL